LTIIGFFLLLEHNRDEAPNKENEQQSKHYCKEWSSHSQAIGM